MITESRGACLVTLFIGLVLSAAVPASKTEAGEPADDDLLGSEHLYRAAYLQEGGRSARYFSEQEIHDKEVFRNAGYLEMELVSKRTFLSEKADAVDAIDKTAAGRWKANGVLNLPVKHATVRFTDNPNGIDEYRIYQYVGGMDALNAHVVSMDGWEHSVYKLIDRANGTSLGDTVDYPYLSPDGTYLIAADADPYERQGILELYHVSNTGLKRVFQAGFLHWMPFIESKDAFWSADGAFYLPVLSSETYWRDDGTINEEGLLYLRIRVGEAAQSTALK